MRIQPPNQNNPTNPLFKVAALTLKRVDSRAKRLRKVRVVASLNFKRSDDVRGIAKSANGNAITVGFSLRLRKASLQITASFDGDASVVPGVSKVAFIYPLEVKDSLREVATVSRYSKKGCGLEGSAGVDAGLSSATLGARGRIRGEAEAGKKAKVEGRSVRAFERTNISATFHENVAHWEINPVSDPTLPGHEPAFLQGEVFRTRAQNRAVDACVVSWKPEEPKGPLVVSGSVYTSMDDLLLDNITFQDNLGYEVRWRDVDAEGRITFLEGLTYSKVKERLAKQIIRKHLQLQGMELDGARVEICKAFA